MGLVDQLSEAGIRLRSYGNGTTKIPCPQCSESRRNKTDPCLSVTIDEDGAKWMCHHCGWKGGASDRETTPYRPRPNGHARPNGSDRKPDQDGGDIRMDRLPLMAVPGPNAIAWFARRAISQPIMEAYGVSVCRTWMPGPNAEVPCIAFPYRQLDGQTVNWKFRDKDKHFKQVKGARKILFGLDHTDPKDGPLIFCEGELDVLAMAEAGIANPVSVPDGAPKKVREGKVDPEDDRKFQYLANCDADIRTFGRYVIATDADEPGRALQEELVRRLGREKCWIVRWPEGCKDANDVLLQHGADALRRCIGQAEPSPVKGMRRGRAGFEEFDHLAQHGRNRGQLTGLPILDPLYTVAPGQLTIVTGIPSHGKSEFIDQLMVNLAQREGWRFLVASFENPLAEHLVKLAEKYTGAPFWDGARTRMTAEERERAKLWIDDHFLFLEHDDDRGLSFDDILEAGRIAILRWGIRGLVIDPWNEIEHLRPDSMPETEYIGDCLRRLRRFARQHGIHIWVVAHPAKMQRERSGTIPVPTLYDISSSAHWYNRADVGIVVHRKDNEPTTDIHVTKVRFKWVGRKGLAALSYDVPTGRYYDAAAETGNLPGLH